LIEFLIRKVMEKGANCLKNIWNTACFEFFEKIQKLVFEKKLLAFYQLVFDSLFYIEVE
jgi:hypothetical protein